MGLCDPLEKIFSLYILIRLWSRNLWSALMTLFHSPLPGLLAGILFAGTGTASASAPGYGPAQAMGIDPAALESVERKPAGPLPA